MTTRPLHRRAAVARRGPTAVVLGAGLLAFGVFPGAPAAAHGPTHKNLRQDPGPGTTIPPGPALDPTRLAAPPPAGGTGAVPTTGVVPLRTLQSRAAATLQATALRTEERDQGRLRIHHLRIDAVLRGHLDAVEIRVVDIRGASQRPPLMADGASVVVLVEPAPALSYLQQQLHGQPDDQLEGAAAFVPAGGRDGVIVTASTAEEAAVAQALADAAAVAALDEAAALAARRRLAFAELDGPSPRLAADALVELRLLPALVPLAPDEVAALGRALRNRRVLPATRARLASLLAERDARQALPALTAAEADTPQVLQAVLEARARLGAPAGREELRAVLEGGDPALRAAAVRALGALADAGVVPDLGRFAITDRDLGVRAAAIEALGHSRRSEAIPILRQTFGTRERDLQQRSARALLEIGGAGADDALIDLALRGETPETRSYAAVLLLATHGREHAAVQRLVRSNPGPEVQAVLEHGLEFRHVHH